MVHILIIRFHIEQTLRAKEATRNVAANGSNETMKQQFLSNKLEAVLSSVLIFNQGLCFGISIPGIYTHSFF